MKIILAFVFLLSFSFCLRAQQADAIIGKWKNGEGTGIIEMYKTTSGHYAGKIIWLKEPIDPETGKPKLDKRNPDKTKRNEPTLGLVNIHGFVFDEEDKIWQDGTIYDPKTGKEYSCKAELKEENKLEVRGYIGVSVFGRTDTWTRLVKK
jgi:uncharacterized protein (DUF2147 family)